MESIRIPRSKWPRSYLSLVGKHLFNLSPTYGQRGNLTKQIFAQVCQIDFLIQIYREPKKPIRRDGNINWPQIDEESFTAKKRKYLKLCEELFDKLSNEEIIHEIDHLKNKIAAKSYWNNDVKSINWISSCILKRFVTKLCNMILCTIRDCLCANSARRAATKIMTEKNLQIDGKRGSPAGTEIWKNWKRDNEKIFFQP